MSEICHSHTAYQATHMSDSGSHLCITADSGSLPIPVHTCKTWCHALSKPPSCCRWSQRTSIYLQDAYHMTQQQQQHPKQGSHSKGVSGSRVTLSWTAGHDHQPGSRSPAVHPQPTGRYSAADLVDDGDDDDAESEPIALGYTDAGQAWQQVSRNSSSPEGAHRRPMSAPATARHSNGVPKSLGMASCAGCGCKSYYAAGGPQLRPCRKCSKVR
jgi:hypothetical protein